MKLKRILMYIVYIAAVLFVALLVVVNYQMLRGRKEEEELEAVLDRMSKTLKDSIESMKSFRR